MRRRALLTVATAAVSVPIAGCSASSGDGDPSRIDGAEVTLRREHTGEFRSEERAPMDVAELHRSLDADPPRITVRGRLLDGSRDCYRVAVGEAELAADALSVRLVTEDRPDWDGNACDDVAQTHPYEVAVEFTEAALPERVAVRHGDESVLDATV
jgi:hypothetical protein